MRTILQTALAIGFVGSMTFSTPIATKAYEVCIGICIIDSDASTDIEERPSRYPHYHRQYRNYDSYNSYYDYDQYQRWTYYEFYYDKWNGSSTQYKTFNRAYDVR